MVISAAHLSFSLAATFLKFELRRSKRDIQFSYKNTSNRPLRARIYNVRTHQTAPNIPETNLIKVVADVTVFYMLH